MLLLYSTNPYVKHLIQKTYAKDTHYVWCSEFFDGNKAPPRTLGTHVAPSSDPFQIYCTLREAVRRADGHDHKVTAQRALYVSLATKWLGGGTISADDHDEIVALSSASIEFFRPLIYVIPYEPVKARVQLVAPANRAGFGREYIIPDLVASEFDVIEGL